MRQLRAVCGLVIVSGIVLGPATEGRSTQPSASGHRVEASSTASPQPTASSEYELEKLRLEVTQLKTQAQASNRKLELDVKKLEQDTSVEGRLRPFVPLIG